MSDAGHRVCSVSVDLDSLACYHAIHGLRRDRPGHFGHVLRHASDDFALKVLDDFRAALFPPHFGGRDLPPVLQCERVGQIGERISFVRIVVCGVGGAGLATRAGPEAFDPQLLHHVFVVLLSRPLQRLGRRAGAHCGSRRGLPMQTANRDRHEQAGCEKEARTVRC